MCHLVLPPQCHAKSPNCAVRTQSITLFLTLTQAASPIYATNLRSGNNSFKDKTIVVTSFELHRLNSPWARSQKDEVAFHPREDTHFFLRNVREIHLKHFFTCPPSRMLSVRLHLPIFGSDSEYALYSEGRLCFLAFISITLT